MLFLIYSGTVQLFLQLGLVCFRLKNDPSNKLNKKLLELINDSGLLHMVPAMVHEKFVIRFCVVSQHAIESDMGKYLLYTYIRYL